MLTPRFHVASRVDGTWQVLNGDRPIGSPRESMIDALGYMHRLAGRYPQGTVLPAGPPAKRRRRGGPYRFSWDDGSMIVPETDLAAAKRALCRQLGRKRLPRGTVVEYV